MLSVHLFEHIRAVAAALIAAFGPGLILAAPAQAGGWEITITPYAWGSLPHGNHLRDHNPVSLEDTLDPFSGGGFVRLRAEKERWSIFAEVNSPDLRTAVVEQAFLEHEAHFQTLELGAGYRLSRNFEILFGARQTRASIYHERPFIRGLIIVTEGATEVAEPFLGGLWSVPLGSRWGIEGRGDIGGFGIGSELIWNAELMVRYDLTRRLSALAGYRVMEVDLERPRDGVYWDAQMPGLVLGLGLRLAGTPEQPIAGERSRVRPLPRPIEEAGENPDPVPPSAEKVWQTTLAVYAWGADLQGVARFDEDQFAFLDEHVDPSDVANPFSDPGFLRFEMSRERWSLLVEGGVFDAVRRQAVDRIDIRHARLELAGAYRPVADLALLFGVLWSELEADVLRTPLLADLFETTRFSSQADWTDSFIGARWTPRLGERWMLEGRGDVGGFGLGRGSELSWNFEAIFLFEAHRRATLSIGFRVLDVDYETRKPIDEFGRRFSRIEWEMQLPGAVAGLRFNF